ncbi:MAG: PilZ domain-containing protein [Gammaproteobacteria bacterium]|nr:PilZ domain-containing protein [Gammaproteobacteria bacterium]
MSYQSLEDPLLFDDAESRRVHERYECGGVLIHYAAFGSNYLQAGNTPMGVAKLKDISLTGLCLETDRSMAIGDTIAVKIISIDNTNIDELNAEIMWCQLKDDNIYNIGLRVIKEETLSFDHVGDVPDEQTVHYLICPDCFETSFYIKTSDNTEKRSAIHTCCRCNSSHMIVEVIAFNRRN